MRLWSLHPRHLDARGLVALWREGLLARAVLCGLTVGYRSHPQLERFRASRDPVATLDAYLHGVLREALARGYAFDAGKLGPAARARSRGVGAGQLELEWRHLLAKLRVRDRARWRRERDARPECHPCFHVVPGGVASWERAGAKGTSPGRSRAARGPAGRESAGRRARASGSARARSVRR